MRKFIMILMTALLVLTLGACGNSEGEKQTNDTTTSPSEEATVTITHELGETEVSKNPEKVVVFDFGILDTLDKLGIEVAGVAQSGVIPSYLDKYTSDDYANIGSLKEPDFDKISEIDPDVIFISERQSEVYDELSKIAPTIFLGVDTTRYMESFKENMEVIGEIFDKEDEMNNEIAAIEEKIQSVEEKAKAMDEKALVILSNDDKVSAYGPNSRFGIIHDVFGVQPVDEDIEASTHGMNISFEYIVEKDPELLYVVDRSAVVDGESSAKQVVENKLVQKTKAYKNDRIVYLDPEIWYLSGGGLVSVEKMVSEIESSIK
ncbi:iron complex transport system substrate-binding protein [Cerasibacillus quisquiliarum]|uniref:Putative ABC transporter solute-binding protein YclQ n=1 Tax=Cerasibacillus quisquiliarum TaxID=227865 RepID=A0A511V167_9BACI|nr:siderophore ABC transporter substrate-binding protein [Cerasibacillus quisquiliarum]MBB5146926.1 iron complex transport system substrate-binding protein [Cerasibacillus quisquiliarum]GEN31751.1 putative ABC transporter solute-binding protein YclQ [Cerasibacillus quisquiliarum]